MITAHTCLDSRWLTLGAKLMPEYGDEMSKVDEICDVSQLQMQPTAISSRSL